MNLDALMRCLERSGFVPVMRGQNVWIKCPFHDDENPSLSISVTKPGHPWLCWASQCSRSGRLGDLVKNVHDNGRTTGVPAKESQITIFPESWLRYYRWRHPYLREERGFPDEVQDLFDVGYDHYRARVTFPVRDEKKRLVGLVGRTVIGEEPRYYYYWHFPKRLCLYGINKVKPNQDLIVTEGVLKVLRLSQWGYPSVAILGSLMSQKQADMIRACNPRRVVMALDPDDAGKAGTKKAFPLLTGLDVWCIITPTDIDELSKVVFEGSVRDMIPWSVWSYKEGSDAGWFGPRT